MFQSTRPVRGATSSFIAFDIVGRVSIHAPRAGRDRLLDVWRVQGRRFNPRAPCGARHNTVVRRKGERSFNPRAPCGARPMRAVILSRAVQFQSTRPVRGATNQECRTPHRYKFQSTRPVRGATRAAMPRRRGNRVSIHAPRAGRDWESGDKQSPDECFNPRAPCGARLNPALAGLEADVFQSTRPVRGATAYVQGHHAHRRGFNPRAPCGARRSLSGGNKKLGCFNPRAPCGARPPTSGNYVNRTCFNPRAPCGARQQLEARLPPFATYLWVFSSTNYDFLSA